MTSYSNAHIGDEMTTDRLYKGVLTELSQRKGVVEHSDDKIEEARHARRYLEGYADGLNIADDSLRHELADRVVSYLDKNPKKKKEKLIIVMREIYANIVREGVERSSKE